MTEPHVLVIGAASLDIKGRTKDALIPNTSNPGQVHFSCGGEARNVAENLARLGLPTKLLSAVGQDSFGQTILHETAAAGVDTSQVIQSAQDHSASYVAIIDHSGNLQVSVDDMDILKLIEPAYIRRNGIWFQNASMIMMDANLMPATIEAALEEAERYDVPVSMNAVSVSLASRMHPYLPHLELVAANLYEAGAIVQRRLDSHQAILGAAKQMVTEGVETAIITMAENGLCYASPNESGYIEAISCDVADNTGAGAALMAAVLYGLVNDMPVDEAMRLGVSAATLTLKCTETVCPDLSLDTLYDQLVI